VSTNAVSLLQVCVLRIPAVREKLKIEKLVNHAPTALPLNAKKKGFIGGIKEGKVSF